MDANLIVEGEFYLIKTFITGNIVSRVYKQDNPAYPYYITAAKYGVTAQEIFPIK